MQSTIRGKTWYPQQLNLIIIKENRCATYQKFRGHYLATIKSTQTTEEGIHKLLRLANRLNSLRLPIRSPHQQNTVHKSMANVPQTTTTHQSTLKGQIVTTQHACSQPDTKTLHRKGKTWSLRQ
jgi:hypothetical protein